MDQEDPAGAPCGGARTVPPDVPGPARAHPPPLPLQGLGAGAILGRLLLCSLPPESTHRSRPGPPPTRRKGALGVQRGRGSLGGLYGRRDGVGAAVRRRGLPGAAARPAVRRGLVLRGEGACLRRRYRIAGEGSASTPGEGSFGSRRRRVVLRGKGPQSRRRASCMGREHLFCGRGMGACFAGGTRFVCMGDGSLFVAGGG
mmetsp:Transcript_58878/g.155864  ORF Transcript_58878/g.155864 Transcript_58878/m.155864 type:complete len:201 (+) Transcript_58878:1142-1744(+)